MILQICSDWISPLIDDSIKILFNIGFMIICGVRKSIVYFALTEDNIIHFCWREIDLTIDRKLHKFLCLLSQLKKYKNCDKFQSKLKYVRDLHTNYMP